MNRQVFDAFYELLDTADELNGETWEIVDTINDLDRPDLSEMLQKASNTISKIRNQPKDTWTSEEVTKAEYIADRLESVVNGIISVVDDIQTAIDGLYELAEQVGNDSYEVFNYADETFENAKEELYG